MKPGTRAPLLVALLALTALAASLLLGRGVEPFATWYYLFAWVPTLVLADAAVAGRRGSWFLLGRPAFTLTLLLWSAPFWLLFEIVNLRLGNWFYVFLPAGRVERWGGILLSFATVLPAILASERLLAAHGVAEGLGSRPFHGGRRLRTGLGVAGLAALALSLAWPRLFFPLVWAWAGLVAVPYVHARDPARSLLADLERGRPGRIVRLLLGGLAIGLLWEIYNAGARGRWIYTLPWLERWKLFEMPLPGYLGFPVFALSGFAAWQALVTAGLAVPREGAPQRAPRTLRALVAAAAFLFAPLALLAVERGTIASSTPGLEGLPGVPAAALARAGWDVFTLARAEPAGLAAATGRPPREAEAWVAAARLATLRGIGTENARRLRAAGISTVGELAAAHPEVLARRLAARGVPIAPARLRVWIQAAREEAAAAGRSGGSAPAVGPRK